MPTQRTAAFDSLLADVRACRACAAQLPLGPRPLLQATGAARILIAGHAPGQRAHASGVPWDDPSGERLRFWMGVASELFYDARRIAIIPMGLCYPGRGPGGDMPPRPECAPLWLDRLLERMPHIELMLLVGCHSQRHFLGSRRKPSLAETAAAWREYGPRYFPLPHPSPRNQPWFQQHPWFEREVIPALRERVGALLAA